MILSKPFVVDKMARIVRNMLVQSGSTSTPYKAGKSANIAESIKNSKST